MVMIMKGEEGRGKECSHGNNVDYEERRREGDIFVSSQDRTGR